MEKMGKVKFWVGVTDNGWFDFLSRRLPDEVNFWSPGGQGFQALDCGGPFLFKLHSPLNYVVGGGFFVKCWRIQTSLAWEAFGEKNGVATFKELVEKINTFRKRPEPNPIIGCIILAEPFFFARNDWIPIPEDWQPNIVRGRRYDTADAIGKRLWTQVQERLSRYPKPDEAGIKEIPVAAEDAELYGNEYLTHARLGQGAFRMLVTEAYNWRCAITGERTLPVLEAAHIKPVSRTGSNRTSNGLLVRSDMHKLFDLGYLTVTPDFHVEVSKRIKEEYENGREYYAFHGSKLRVLPANPTERPSLELIEWHNQNIYVP